MGRRQRAVGGGPGPIYALAATESTVVPVETVSACQDQSLSTDPQFIAKARDVVGLYMSPPEHALVLAVDEKSQIQALDRTAPCLPMLPATPERRTRDYVRHGTTSLFAACCPPSTTLVVRGARVAAWRANPAAWQRRSATCRSG